MLRKPTTRLQRKRAHFILGAGAVGAALGVAKVVDGLVRQRRRNRARNRQTAQTRIEHANRARVACRILDIGHYLTSLSRKDMSKCSDAALRTRRDQQLCRRRPTVDNFAARNESVLASS